MEIAGNLLLGLEEALSAINLLYCLAGVSIGMFIGVIPGIGHLAAISLLMPLTFHVPTTASLVMLGGIYYGAQYGGSIASILLNMPGTASSAVLCLDGHPLTRRGRARSPALLLTTFASFFGSVVAIVLLVALAPPLARAALDFHSADYFSMMLLGLVCSATLVQGRPLIGLASVAAGLVIGIAGTDVNTGALRFTFGHPSLFDGVSLIIVAMAFFGIAEVVTSIGTDTKSTITGPVRFRAMLPSRKELRESAWPMVRGAAVGSGIGILPGAGGGSMAAFMAYAIEKRISRKPEQFGQGAIAGISAPESANNSAAQSAFIPTLTLGIPGDAIMALILGALLIHGIMPGPRVVTDTPELFWGLVMSFLIGNLMLLVLNIPLIQLWVRILQIPYSYLFPTITLAIAIGCYSIAHASFDVMLVTGMGVAATLMIALGFEVAPLLLGFILGPMLEENFRRALLIGRGDLMVFVERPISAIFVAFSLALLLWTFAPGLRRIATRSKSNT